jgi:hypothetical protein
MRKYLIPLFALAICAVAADRIYMTGTLSGLVIEDMSTTMSLPPIGQNTSGIVLPIPMGVLYRFDIEADRITYLAECASKKKKSFAAEWVVHDPVQFRVQKDKLFLKAPSGKELRLALITKVRAVSSGALGSAPSASARQEIPECRWLPGSKSVIAGFDNRSDSSKKYNMHDGVPWA